MSSITKKLTQAINTYSEQSTDVNENEGIQAFIALFSMLGEDELHDGIATAMQDEGYDEVYEEIMYNYDELDEEEN